MREDVFGTPSLDEKLTANQVASRFNEAAAEEDEKDPAAPVKKRPEAREFVVKTYNALNQRIEDIKSGKVKSDPEKLKSLEGMKSDMERYFDFVKAAQEKHDEENRKNLVVEAAKVVGGHFENLMKGGIDKGADGKSMAIEFIKWFCTTARDCIKEFRNAYIDKQGRDARFEKMFAAYEERARESARGAKKEMIKFELAEEGSRTPPKTPKTKESATPSLKA